MTSKIPYATMSLLFSDASSLFRTQADSTDFNVETDLGVTFRIRGKPHVSFTFSKAGLDTLAREWETIPPISNQVERAIFEENAATVSVCLKSC